MTYEKFLAILMSRIPIVTAIYLIFIYFAIFSEGVHSIGLIKITKKGMIVKTWKREISKGISDAQIFYFSIKNKYKIIIADLQKHQEIFLKFNYIK